MSAIPAALANQRPAEMAVRNSLRRRQSAVFYGLCIAIALVSVLVLVILLLAIAYQGYSRLSVSLLTHPHSELEPAQSGMGPAIIGSLVVCLICACTALPLGIGTAVFLEEFQPQAKVLRWLHGFIQLNIANLAGVPSIVYGLLGLTVFVSMFNAFGKIQVNGAQGWELWGVKRYYQLLTLVPGQTVLVPVADAKQSKIVLVEPTMGIDATGRSVQIEVWNSGMAPRPTDPTKLKRTVKRGAVGGVIAQKSWYYARLPFGKSFVAAGLTLALVILPVIIIVSQEALRAVSPSQREAALGLGATRWQATRNVCLPAAMPGILTGAILAMGRAIGEAAPVLVVLGAGVAKNGGPCNLMDTVVTMPVLIFNWAGRPQAVYQELAAAGIIVMLIVLLTLNLVAIFLRQKMQPR